VELLFQTLRDSFRSLRHSPGFATSVIVILSICFAFNTILFTLVNGILLTPLGYKDPERLVWIWSTRTDRDKAFFSIPNFEDTRSQNHTLKEMAAFANWGANLTDRSLPQRLQGIRISANAFAMMGVKASAGRVLIPADDFPDSARVVVLSNGTYSRYFGANPNVVGSKIILNDDPYIVVGVLPKDFVIPNAEVDMIGALRMASDPRRTNRGANFLRVLARLKNESTLEETRSDLALIADRLRKQYPDDNGKLTAPTVKALHQEIAGDYHMILLVLFGAVGLVLLIACANLAHLLIARSVRRNQELALRIAIGSDTYQILFLLLFETALLVLPAALIGFVLAFFSKEMVLQFAPDDLPRAAEITFGLPIFIFQFLVCALVSLFFTFLLYFQAKKLDISFQLKAGKGNTSGSGSRRIRDALMISEIAFTLLLLLFAAIWLKNFLQLQKIYPGFDPKNLTAIKISFSLKKYPDPLRVRVFYERLISIFSKIPEVSGVAAANVVPLSGMNVRTEFFFSAKPPTDPKDMPAAQNRWISPEYFSTTRIPVLQGREFTINDGAKSSRVVIVDQALLQKYWQRDNLIGQQIILSFSAEQQINCEIVGVVGNVKHSELNEESTPTLYAPLFQMPQDNMVFLSNNMSIFVRSKFQNPLLLEKFRSTLKSVDPEIPASSMKPTEQLLTATMASRRFFLDLMIVFGIIGLILSSFGLYAVLSQVVTQRSQEIGIRIAVGADRKDVLRMITGEGMKLTLIGLLCGLIVSVPVGLLMSRFLFQFEFLDSKVFLAVAIFLLCIAILASWIPARRAGKVDPIVVLRQE
jgi:predicted permease